MHKETAGYLSGSLFNELGKDILQGRLKPGEKLSEQQVCEMYGLSRTPVREAFRQLEMGGLIETIPNRGAFIVGMTDRDISDIYEMRKSYEIIAVRWAVERATDEDLRKIEEAYEFMEFYTMKKDADKMLNINMDFHNLIYKAAHNRMLYHTLSIYQFYMKQLKTNNAYLTDRLIDVLAEHKMIINALVEKDAEGAAEAVAAHLDNARDRAKI